MSEDPYLTRLREQDAPKMAARAKALAGIEALVALHDVADGRPLTRNQQRSAETLRQEFSDAIAAAGGTHAFSTWILADGPSIDERAIEAARVELRDLVFPSERLAKLADRMEAPGSFHSTVEPHLRASRESTGEFGVPAFHRSEHTRMTANGVSYDPLAIFKNTILEERSTSTTSGSSALATVQYSDQFVAALTGHSILLSAGVRTFSTDSTQYVIPTSTAAAAVSWVSEGGTASATDATYAKVTATPAKLVCVSEFTSEVLEDASFDLRNAAANEIYKSMAFAIDQVAFGTAATPFPGLGLNAAGGTVTPSGGTVLNLDPFITAAGSAMAQNVPLGALTWVSNPIVWQRLGGIHIGGTANDIRPILTADTNQGGGAALSTSELIGRPWWLTTAANAAGGTAFVLGFDPQMIGFTTRREFNLVIDPYSKAEQGVVRFIATLRASVNALQPTAVVKVAGLVA